VLLTRRKKNDNEVNGGDNSTNPKNIGPDKRAIHIHARMEHNLARHAINYSCKSTKILRGSDYTRKIDYSRRDFSGY